IRSKQLPKWARKRRQPRDVVLTDPVPVALLTVEREGWRCKYELDLACDFGGLAGREEVLKLCVVHRTAAGPIDRRAEPSSPRGGLVRRLEGRGQGGSRVWRCLGGSRARLSVAGRDVLVDRGRGRRRPGAPVPSDR